MADCVTDLGCGGGSSGELGIDLSGDGTLLGELAVKAGEERLGGCAACLTKCRAEAGVEVGRDLRDGGIDLGGELGDKIPGEWPNGDFSRSNNSYGCSPSLGLRGRERRVGLGNVPIISSSAFLPSMACVEVPQLSGLGS